MENIIPQDIETLANSPELTDMVLAIGAKNNLHIDKTGLLSDVIDWVLNGSILANKFEQSIESTLKLSPQIATQVAADVNEQIFKPVQDSLRAMQTDAEKGSVEEKHLSREELLHQLENPVAIPMSGRREGGIKTEFGNLGIKEGNTEQNLGIKEFENANGPRFVVGKSGMVNDTESDSLGGSTSKSEEEVKPRTQEADTEEGRPVPISTPSRPRTILERKLAEPTVVDKNAVPVDPYREATG